MTCLYDSIADASRRISGARLSLVEGALEQVMRSMGAWDGTPETKREAALAAAGRVAIGHRHTIDETLILLDGKTIGAIRGKWEGTTYTAALEWLPR